MNRSYRIIPCYTGDVSGVASALFEMGGMVVIHDPSGCNSTYNTHDETRWYDMDSLIFISGLSHTDAVMGDDEKLLRQIEEAAEQLHPAFIALASSPIPYMNGTDFPALARLIRKRTGIPAFFAPSNGMHDYVYGAGQAFLAAAKVLLDQEKKPSGKPLGGIPVGEKKTAAARSSGSGPAEKVRVNLLGVTPLEFAAEGSAESLKKDVRENGLELQSCWAMGDSPEQLFTAPEASVNLVVSSVGLPMAGYMEEKWGIPWVAGCPAGAFTEVLFDAVKQTAGDGISRIPYLERDRFRQSSGESDEAGDGPGSSGTEPAAAGNSEKAGASSLPEKKTVHLIGEPVTMGSLAAAITMETGACCRVICPVEAKEELTGKEDCRTFGEEEAEEALKSAEVIVADPLYRPICPAGARVLELPHQAFSGRCFRRRMMDLTELTWEKLVQSGEKGENYGIK